MYENELWELPSESFPPFSNVVKLAPVQTVSVFVVADIMANAPVGFPVPQMQEGLDEREALDCFILDYIDYCTVITGKFYKKPLTSIVKPIMGIHRFTLLLNSH